MPRKRTYRAPKSDFILAHPTLSGAEIVARATARGLEISPNLVYVVRSRRSKNLEARSTRATSRTNRAAAIPPARARGPAKVPAPPLTANEKRLAELVITLGLGRVESLVARVRKALR